MTIPNTKSSDEILEKYSGEKTHAFDLAHSYTLNELKQRITGIVNDYGFTHFSFSRLGRTWSSNSDFGLMHTLPDELMRIYHDNKHYTFDLLIEYCKFNTQPIFSSQVYHYIDNAPFELQLTHSTRHLLKLHKRFGFYEMCVIPMPALNGNGQVQLIIAKAGASMEEIQLLAAPLFSTFRKLCKEIDSVTTKKFQSSFIEPRDKPLNITRKPLEILRQMALKDITITALAADLCVSPITAHQHISAARKALGVKTNIGAIIKAIRAGLIQLD